jgi:hypothetical protein
MLSKGDICCFPSPSYCEYMGVSAPIWEMDVLLDTLRSPNSLLLWCLQPSWDPFRPIPSFCEHEQIKSKNKKQKQTILFRTCFGKIGSIGMCPTVLPTDILAISGATNWDVPLRICEVKNFAAAPTPRQFSTSIIRNSLCTYLILESNICFCLIFQSNIFNTSTVINGSFPINSPTFLCVIPTAGFIFFLKGPQ